MRVFLFCLFGFVLKMFICSGVLYHYVIPCAGRFSMIFLVWFGGIMKRFN